MKIEKNQLFQSLWNSCDSLRGSMEPNVYKDYILRILFLKYISDKVKNQNNLVEELPEGTSFENLVSIKNQPDIGAQINELFKKLAKANDLTGELDSIDWNDEKNFGSGKSRVTKLTNLISHFQDLDFTSSYSKGSDILGDAYEFLMMKFAIEAGKDKGQFYTPSEVSKLIAKVLDISKVNDPSTTIYDPTCGSGSLLIKLANEAKSNVSIYGQEILSDSVTLCKLNMWIHGFPTAELKGGESTLQNPMFTEGGRLKQFDYVVANPPFSDKNWTDGFSPNEDIYNRFQDYKETIGDYAYLLHVLHSTKEGGKAAIILPKGVLFRDQEHDVRKKLIEEGYLDLIINMPPNLFYGTQIPACILFLTKSKRNKNPIKFIDASKLFIKDGDKNKLQESDLLRILNYVENLDDVEYYSKKVSFQEIEKNNFNLNHSRYLKTRQEDTQYLVNHISGGIPGSEIKQLSEYFSEMGEVFDLIFDKTNNSLNTEIENYFEFVFKSNDFQKVLKNLDPLKKELITELDNIIRKQLTSETFPEIKSNIQTLLFDKLKSIDNYLNLYEVIQLFFEYWSDVLEDDLFDIYENGYSVAKETLQLTEYRNKKNVEIKGFKGLEGRLIPKKTYLRNKHYTEFSQYEDFKNEYLNVREAQKKLVSENSFEGEVFYGLVNSQNNISKDSLKNLKNNYQKYDVESQTLIMDIEKLKQNEADLNKKIKFLENQFSNYFIDGLKILTEEEIVDFLIYEKWINKIIKIIDLVVYDGLYKVEEKIEILKDRYSKTFSEALGEFNENLNEFLNIKDLNE